MALEVMAGVAAWPQVASALFDDKIGWGDSDKVGVQWDGGFANPLASQPDEFSTEVVNGKGNPVVISFTKPKKWKLSTNAGITVQDYITAESAFVLVAPAQGHSVSDLPPEYVLDKVFDSRGRYGTYGKVDSVKVTTSKVEQEGLFSYKYIDFKFTSLGPGGREIERNGCLKATIVDDDVIMFVSSSTSNRWKSVKSTIASSVVSFQAFPAPKTKIKGAIESGIGNKNAMGVDGYDLLRFDSPVWSK